ncbi:MAG TPA: hypothetical protein PKD61_10895, partial [Polyangiaceae bacterium]|nr:hypothetical protein [Polyangiaceae bacterium]
MNKSLCSSLLAVALIACGSDDDGSAKPASGGTGGNASGGSASGGTAGSAGAGAGGGGAGGAAGSGGSAGSAAAAGAGGSAGSGGAPSTSAFGPQPVAPTALSEGTIFAAHDGSGTTCSQTAPCDLWAAVQKAKGGDVVFLRGGTYAISKNLSFSNKASSG